MGDSRQERREQVMAGGAVLGGLIGFGAMAVYAALHVGFFAACVAALGGGALGVAAGLVVTYLFF